MVKVYLGWVVLEGLYLIDVDFVSVQLNSQVVYFCDFHNYLYY